MILSTTQWDDYELLDTGNCRKLERYGQYILDRPSPQALWEPAGSKKLWATAHGIYHRSSSGGGKWEYVQALPETWTVRRGNIQMIVRPTGFGHLGIFPEQAPCWDWIAQRVGDAGPESSVLNLFAYTGGSTLAAAAAGAEVCHVDGSRGTIAWGRQNADLNNLSQNPVRWIADDVTKFVTREVRRGNIYHGIILDPPTFGRGPKGQVWKIEQHLTPLLESLNQILAPESAFVLITCHSQHVSPVCLKNLLTPMSKKRDVTIESGEIVITHDKDGWGLPAGFFARLA